MGDWFETVVDTEATETSRSGPFGLRMVTCIRSLNDPDRFQPPRRIEFNARGAALLSAEERIE